MLCVLVFAAAVCALAFVYPYIIYPFVLRFVPSAETELHSKQQGPLSAALLFCAYNEADSLADKISNIRDIKKRLPNLSVSAYSDCSNDGTNELLLAASDVLTPVLGTERLGKVLGMQKLVTQSTADILIFTDANVMVDPDGAVELVKKFNDPTIGAVAGTLLYDVDTKTGDEAGKPVAQVGGLYWRLEEHIKQLESHSGSMMGADGALFARRREGYPSLPPDLVDDMGCSLAAVFDGLRCVSAPDVLGFEESVQNSSEEFRRKRRIACGSYSTYRYLKPQIRQMSLLNRFKFYSHKVVRWWGGFFLLAAALFAFSAAAVGGFFLPFAGFSVFFLLAMWLGVVFDIGPICALYEILAAITATALGVLESLGGKQYQTWTPATSR